MKGKKIHYAWFILVACCLLQAGGIGILSNTSSVFISAVCQDRNLSFVDKAFTAELGEQEFTVINAEDYESEAAYGAAIVEKYGSVENYAQLANSYKTAVSNAANTFTVYMMLQGLVAALLLPFAGKLLSKVNIRLIISIGAVVICATFALMSQFSQMWQWYIAGAVMGIGSTVIFILPSPIMIGNWFRKKMGLAMGLSMAFANIGGAVMSPIIAKFISAWGWSGAYIATAIVSIVLILPCSLFIIRFKPSDVGLEPYGAAETPDNSPAATQGALSGVSTKKAVFSAAFVLLSIMTGLLTFNTTYTNTFATYGDSLGMSAEKSALIVSCVLIGGILFKLILGALNDKIGISKTMIIGSVFSILSFASLILGSALVGTASVFFAYVGAFLLGVLGAMMSTCLPIAVRKVFGSKDFGSIYGIIVSIMSICGSLAVVLIFKVVALGDKITLFDNLGRGYAFAFTIGIAFCIISAICAVAAFKSGEKLLAKESAE